ncbi:MAG: NADPH-dependent oxidoreductase [Rhodospirillaceae bacterium]|nr:NADPH-dependent oxidoreductase [Rhodospirillaceae bacterium]
MPENLNSSSVIDTLRGRASVRDFKSDELSDEMLNAILNAARQAPTSSNLQAYSFVVVRDPEAKKRLAAMAGGQQHVIDAPAFVAICADTHRLSRVTASIGSSIAKDHLEMTMVACIDAALVGMCASLASDSLGLGTVMIGGMRNDPAGVAAELGLPDGVFVAFGLCVGWPNTRPEAKPRLPQDMVIHHEKYADGDLAAGLGDYETAMSEHHRHVGRDPDEPWAERVAKQFSAPKREHLLAVLKERGFGFD